MAEHLTLALILFGIFPLCCFIGIASVMIQLKKKLEVRIDFIANKIKALQTTIDVVLKPIIEDIIITEFNRVIDPVNEIFNNFTKSNKDINDKLDQLNQKIDHLKTHNLDILWRQVAEQDLAVRRNLNSIYNKLDALDWPMTLLTELKNMTKPLAPLNKEISGQLEMIGQNIRQILTNLTFTEVLSGGVPIENVVTQPPKDIEEWANEVLAPKLTQQEIPLPVTQPPQVFSTKTPRKKRRHNTTNIEIRQIRHRLLAGESAKDIRKDMQFADSTWERALRIAKTSGTHGWYSKVKKQRPTVIAPDKLPDRKISPDTHFPTGRRFPTTKEDLAEIKKRLAAGEVPNDIRYDMGFSRTTWSHIINNSESYRGILDD